MRIMDVQVPRWFAVLWVTGIVTGLGLLLGLGYVVLHFIGKAW